MSSVIEQCKRCLEEEYEVIRSGDWNGLSGVLESKTDAMGALGLQKIPLAELQSLTPLIERNQKLMAASQSGIEAALKRLAQITQSLKQSQVYGPNGTFQDIAAPTNPSLEKRS